MLCNLIITIKAENKVKCNLIDDFCWSKTVHYNGYPTGYIITWKNPDVKTKDGMVAGGKHVLIDGQQRVTALMAAISGLEVLDEDFNRDRIKIAFSKASTWRRLCFVI